MNNLKLYNNIRRDFGPPKGHEFFGIGISKLDCYSDNAAILRGHHCATSFLEKKLKKKKTLIFAF